MNWDLLDFVMAGLLIGGVVGAFALVLWRAKGGWVRAGAGFALFAGLLLIWVNLAVGIIGSENNPANLMYGGVLLAALGGSMLARFRPPGLARAMLAAAGVQILVAIIALSLNLGTDGSQWPRDVIVITTVFCGLWSSAALLFWLGHRKSPPQGPDKPAKA